MALGSTQPLTEMSTRGTFLGGGVKQNVRRAGKLAVFTCRLSINSVSLKLLQPRGPVQACDGGKLN